MEISGESDLILRGTGSGVLEKEDFERCVILAVRNVWRLWVFLGEKNGAEVGTW